jgi:hypothetical protein
MYNTTAVYLNAGPRMVAKNDDRKVWSVETTDVVFLGAGFSRAVDENAPLMPDFFRGFRAPTSRKRYPRWINWLHRPLRDYIHSLTNAGQSIPMYGGSSIRL